MLEHALMTYLRRLNRRSMRFGPAGTDIMPVAAPGRKYLLYIHIPFCEVLCPFCSFHRVQLKRPKADRYFEGLRRELRYYSDAGFEFADIYVGGGTPTVIPEELGKTLALCRELFPIERVSIETNPDHLTRQRCDALLEMGVNRVSVGVQSFDDDLLKAMGRYERYGSGAEIRSRLKEAAGVFETLNVDMIFNQPHQTLVSLQRDIDILHTDLSADQVSFYPLMPAATTAKAMSKSMGKITFRREREFYSSILANMRPTFQPSTAWCFARQPGLIDEYIVDHDNYIGVGSGAFSYINGYFYSSSFSIERYINRVSRGNPGIVMGRALGETERLRYRFLLGLFGLRLDWNAFLRDAPHTLLPPLWKERLFFKLIGAIRKDAGHYRLTDNGMYYWVVMMREFLTGVNNFRDEMRSHIRIERMLDKIHGENEQVESMAFHRMQVGDDGEDYGNTHNN